MRLSGNTIISTIKTCFRCGTEFCSAGRVCPACRKAGSGKQKAATWELTFRERQVTDLVSQATPTKEIAFELRLTESTVRQQLSRIFRKLEVKNRIELAMWAAVRNHLAGEHNQGVDNYS